MRIVVETPVVETPRLAQLRGLFDLPPAKSSRREWSVDLPLAERPWSVGLIVGPSGCGKSQAARALWPESMQRTYDWPEARSVVDGFPASLDIQDITELLSSVGFSSPPAWCRPFRVLSNGEQFRATVARALAEAEAIRKAGESAGPVVIDEWTSVVDRQVAQVASHAAAKTVRRRGQQLVAVSCHYDVIDWLDPDWVFEPETEAFAWRSLRRRPEIRVELVRADRSAWHLFRDVHYLSGELHRSAMCWVACVGGRPAAFAAMLGFPHPKTPGYRFHRLVTLPDYQGVGLGRWLASTVASMYAVLKPVYLTTSHPGLCAAFRRAAEWRMRRAPAIERGHHGGNVSMAPTAANDRVTSGWAYRGEANPVLACQMGLVKGVAGRWVKA